MDKYSNLNKIYAICEPAKPKTDTNGKVLLFPTPPHLWNQWSKTLRAVITLNRLRIRQQFQYRHFWGKNAPEMRGIVRELVANTRQAEARYDDLCRYIVKYALRGDGVVQ